MTITTDVARTVAALRRTVAGLHVELTRYQLVIWTAGNVSARVPGQDLMVIKPSGVSYDELSADAMVVTDLHGNLVEGEREPSSDTAAHAYVYRHLPDVGGVAHTHSTYATAWWPGESRSPACSPWSPTSSAARFRSDPSPRSGTTRSGVASWRRCDRAGPAPS